MVELLQQELHAAEKQNQVPGHAFYCFTLCVCVCVCVVDGAFVSSSEVTRLGFFWRQVSITKSAGVSLRSGVRAAGLCAQLTAATARQRGAAAAGSGDPGREQVDRVCFYP